MVFRPRHRHHHRFLLFTNFPPLIAAGFYVYAVADVLWHNVIKPRRIAREEVSDGA